MRGSTRRRGATWTAYWSVPGRLDPDTGKTERRQKTRGGFTRQKDAQQFLNDTLVKIDLGTYSEPSKMPLCQFLTGEWLPAIRGTVRPLTFERYGKIVSTYLAPRDIGSVQLRGLSPGHCNALYSELERDGLSPATRRLVHAVLHRSLGDAVRWGKLARGPAAAADPPSLPRSRAQAWTARELRTFLEIVGDDRLYGLWRLAATTGMRRGELLGLPWRCVDLEGARLRVEQQLVPTKGGCTFGPPKSRRSERTIALDAATVQALLHHRELQKLERDLAGPACEDHDLVFCNELGQPIYPQRLTESFSRHRKAAGIPMGSLHILRHTSATIALTASPPVPLHVVAGRLGDDAKTLLSTYAHLLPHGDAMAADAVAASLVAATAIDPSAVLAGR